MKKSLFKKAWDLFRKFQMTFSQALIEAWKMAKREILIKAYNKIPSTKSLQKKKLEAKKLWQAIETITYPWRSHLVTNNSGAAGYYGIGKYNGD
ncbi:hypothetical protein EV143_1324 [Flavobacterium chryseum]|uniref:hypothetical protein n=1 Tax=Flavobacterium sp. P3160 TaxID=2512113 RepID=UPI00105EDA95|nr:hypothetical protein [Flavobacterium sp. P3160]TDO67093.1 hypothetical protein EV143_1324 [Flavobacterium sp. P3160]